MRSFWLGAIILSLATLARAQAPAVNSGGVVNSASYSAQGVAPGSIVSIFGKNLASQPGSSNSIPLSTALGNVTSVTFGGVAASLYFVSPLQINAQLPWNVLPSGGASSTVNVVVTTSGGSSAPQSVTVLPTMPGIFTVTANGLGQAVATDNADGAVAAPTGSIAGANTHPIQIGSYLIIWCTGLGAVDAPLANGANTGGQIVNTLAKPTVTIGGVPATLIYSILAPQYVSEYQVAVQVAAGTPTGNAVPLQIQMNGVTTSNNVTIAVAGATVTGLFNTLTPTVTQFDAASIPGLPQVYLTSNTAKASVGYQMGDYITDTPDGPVALLYPWRVLPGGGSGVTPNQVPHGVMLAYKTSGSFTSAGSYMFFDMTSLTNPALHQSNPAGSYLGTTAGIGCGGGSTALDAEDQTARNAATTCPVSYSGSVVVSNRWVYLMPDSSNPYPVFVLFDSSQRVTTSTAYYIWTAPARSSPVATNPLAGGCTTALQSAGRCPAYGWNGNSYYDGRYVYYTPIIDGLQSEAPGANCGAGGCNDAHGNIARFDTQCTTGTFPTNFSNSACWSSFDMGNNLDQTAGAWNGVCGTSGSPLIGPLTECAVGFFASVYDGHKYAYYIPLRGSVMVRYDTTADFQSAASYTTMDLSQLSAAGYPTAGGGNGSALCPPSGGVCGLGGATIVYSPSQGNNSTAWLYLAPFGNRTSQSLTLYSVTARVKIGTIDGSGNWSPVDITASGSTWEIFDLNSLQSNPQFAANGWSGPDCGSGGQPGCTYPAGNGLAGQSTIAGYQLGWTNTYNTPNRPVYGNCDSRFWVEHDPTHALYDPTGWYVGYVTPIGPTNNTFGGAYNAAGQTAWPGVLSGMLVQASGI